MSASLFLPCKYSPGELPDPGIEPGSPALQADALPSEPQRKPLCIYTLTYNICFFLTLVLFTLYSPYVLNPCSPARFCKEAGSWAAAISVFPRPHQGLAHWPADKCFPNWWMTAARISGPTSCLLALVGLMLSCMGTSIVSTSIFLKLWKSFANTWQNCFADNR